MSYRRVRAWLTALAIAGCAVEQPLDRAATPIVRGEVDEADPAVVSVGGFCTGTLVSPRTVLTAHHCLGGGSTPGYSIFFGTYEGGDGTRIAAIHQERYPGGGPGSGDIAMVTLAEPGPAEPIPVNDRDLAAHVGAPVRIVGFGVTAEGGGGGGTKRWGESSLDSVNAAEMVNSNDVSGTCYGDSGGPNFMTFDGVEYVAGVTSYGTAACGYGQDVAGRTDPYIDWIRDYIAAHDPADCGADGRCAADCGAVDPDCPCAADGLCTDACEAWQTDPDCAGCEADGECRADCPELDADCCAADGLCAAECGALDPDCDGGGGGGGDDDDDDGGGGGGGGGDGPIDSGVVVGGCSAGGGGSGAPLVAVLIALLARLARRRRATSRTAYTSS